MSLKSMHFKKREFKPHEIINIVLAGTAGQGVITIKRLIEFAAHESGCKAVFGSEMHGLAQREGAITSHTRYQKEMSLNMRENLYSPSICYGDADLYIGFEPVEVLRRLQFASKKTLFCINSRTIPPILVSAKIEQYPSLDTIKKILGAVSDNVYFINVTKIAIEKFQDPQKMNMIMLGFAVSSGYLPFIDSEIYENVIKRELKQPNINIKAFRLGQDIGKKYFK
ncbi:MAG: 2-oxoacid:acceptor oxidoreductase family protein [Promethearchaeota archaeon]